MADNWQPLLLPDGSYSDDTRPWSAQDLVNYLPVKAEQGGTLSTHKLRTAPGMKRFAYLGAKPVRGMHDVEGKLYVVAGDSLHRVFPDGQSENLGAIPGTGRVQMVHNQVAGGNQLVIATRGNGTWVYADEGAEQAAGNPGGSPGGAPPPDPVDPPDPIDPPDPVPPDDDPTYYETWQERSSPSDWYEGEPLWYIGDGRDEWVFKGQTGYSYCTGGLTTNVSAQNGTAGPAGGNTAMKFKGIPLTAHTASAQAKFTSDLASEESHGGNITDSVTYAAKPTYSLPNWYKRSEGVGMPAATLPGTVMEIRGVGFLETRAEFTDGQRIGEFAITGMTTPGGVYLSVVAAHPDQVDEPGAVTSGWTFDVQANGTYALEIDADTGAVELYDAITDAIVASGTLALPADHVYRYRWGGTQVGVEIHSNFGNETFVRTPTSGFGGVPNMATSIAPQWRGIGYDGLLSSQGAYGALRYAYGGAGLLLTEFGFDTGHHHVEFYDSAQGTIIRYGLCTASQTGELGITGDSVSYNNSSISDRVHRVKWTWGGGGEVTLPAGFGTPEEGLVHSRPSRVAFAYNATAATIAVWIKESYYSSGWRLLTTLTSVPAEVFIPARWQTDVGPSIAEVLHTTTAPTGADDWLETA